MCVLYIFSKLITLKIQILSKKKKNLSLMFCLGVVQYTS